MSLAAIKPGERNEEEGTASVGHSDEFAGGLPSGRNLIHRTSAFIAASQSVAESIVALSKAAYRYPGHAVLSTSTHHAIIDTRLSFITISAEFEFVLRLCADLVSDIEAFWDGFGIRPRVIVDKASEKVEEIQRLSYRLGDAILGFQETWKAVRHNNLKLPPQPKPFVVLPYFWHWLPTQNYQNASVVNAYEVLDGFCSSVDAGLAQFVDTYRLFQSFWTLWDELNSPKAQSMIVSLTGDVVKEEWDVRETLEICIERSGIPGNLVQRAVPLLNLSPS